MKSDPRRRIETDKAPPSTGFRSQAVAVEGLLFTGGMIGAPMESSDGPATVRAPAETLHEQVELCLRHLEQITIAGGGDRGRVVEVSSFPINPEYLAPVQQQVTEWLGYAPPLYNQHAVHDVAAHALLELDWIAAIDPTLPPERAAEWLAPMGKQAGLQTSGPFLFLNGVAAPNAGITLGEQSEALFVEAGKQLAAAGSGLERLVKMIVYIAEFDPYPQFNDVTRHIFANTMPPTRSVLVAPAVTSPGLVRIDFVALRG